MLSRLFSLITRSTNTCAPNKLRRRVKNNTASQLIYSQIRYLQFSKQHKTPSKVGTVKQIFFSAHGGIGGAIHWRQTEAEQQPTFSKWIKKAHTREIRFADYRYANTNNYGRAVISMPWKVSAHATHNNNKSRVYDSAYLCQLSDG